MNRQRVPAPADKNVPLSVNTILVFNDEKFCFGLSPRCPTSRLYENAGKPLGIRVTKIMHQKSFGGIPVEIPNDPNVWVLEDCGVKEGHRLFVFGEPLGGEPLSIEVVLKDEMVKMKLSWPDHLKEPTDFFVRHGATVQDLLKSIRLHFDVIPDTLKLFYQGKELTIRNQVLELKEGELITMMGTYFPAKLLGAEFASNMGVFPSTECVVCLEAMKKAVCFECGHVNVCSGCWKDRPKTKCPICK